jgi:type II secretory pathway component PulF
VWEFPVSFVLKLTIPRTGPMEWNRFYLSANIALFPVAFLYACNSFMPLDHPIVFRLPLIPTLVRSTFLKLFARSSALYTRKGTPRDRADIAGGWCLWHL